MRRLHRFAAAALFAVLAFAFAPPQFAQAQNTLTAAFENVPNGHDGSSLVVVRLRFSEEIDLSAQAFRDGLLTIDGGMLHNQRRLIHNPISDILWEIEVMPGGEADVTITLPTHPDSQLCDPTSVPCTGDGRRLQAPVSVTVHGPLPDITSATSLAVAENQTAVATLTATDTQTQASALTWSIPAGGAGGADRDKFTLSTAGALAFKSAKDFEDPDDANGDGNYQVTVRVSDRTHASTADLTVTLTNVNERPTAEAGATSSVSSRTRR